MEEYAIRLGKTFLENYPLIAAVSVTVDQAPWEVAGGQVSQGTTLRR